MKKILITALLTLLAGCGSAVIRPQLPADISPKEAAILYSQYHVTERGSYFLKKYVFNGTAYRGPELAPLFEAPYVKEETASAFDRFNIYSIAAITGALTGGFSLAYNFGRMGVEKKTSTWVWITGGTGTATMFIFQYLAERAASDAFRRYNLDLKAVLGLAPMNDEITSPSKKQPGEKSAAATDFLIHLGLAVRF